MRKIAIVFVITMCLSLLFSVNIFALDKVTITEGTYILESKLGTNMVMDVDDASKKAGANIQLYKYNGSSAQQFTIKKSGSYYTITPKCSGLKVDVQGGSTKSGANVQQYKSNNTDSQKWRFYDAGNGYYYIRCKIGDKTLDVSGGKSVNGTNIQMYNLNQTDSQKWRLIKVNSSKTVKIKGHCYDVYGRNAMQSNSKAILYSKNDKVLGTAKGGKGSFSLKCSVKYPDSPSYIIIETKVDGYKASGIYKLSSRDIENISNSKEIYISCPVYIGWKYKK